MTTTRKSTTRKSSSVNKSNIPDEYFTKFNMHKNLVKHSKTKSNLYIALVADNPELHNLEIDFGDDSVVLHKRLSNTINIRDKNNNLHTVNKKDISKRTLIWHFACNKTDTNSTYDYDKCEYGNDVYLRDFIVVEYKKKFSLGNSSSQKVITRKNKKRWFGFR